MTNDLIYDVGMYDGYDTAYYLTCGFRVIAIEANPSLVALAQKRFEAEIEAGKLTIINVGISDHSTVAEFWVSDELPAVSTFSKDLTTRFNVPHHPIQVQCKPLSEIVSEYGVPYYLKIDIEDYDIVCLNQLTLATKPTFISVEMTSEESGGQLLVRLRELRYDRFKIINQRHLLPIGGQQMGLLDSLSLGQSPHRYPGAAVSSRSRRNGRNSSFCDVHGPMGSLRLPVAPDAGVEVQTRFLLGFFR
jgi:FkbM family methyltransferase